MWIALAIVGGLVGLIALLALVGVFIAREHVATSAVTVRARPHDVWPLVEDQSTWPSWNAGVKKIERLPDADGRPVWRMTSAHGPLVTVVTESAPPRRYVTRITDDELPYGGRWVWELEPAGDGETRVAITEDGFIRNVVFRSLAKLVFGYHGSIESTLRSLARKFGDERPVVERLR